MTILEERGLFWWHSEPVPDTRFAPDASALGLLSIGDDGVATLLLDGFLPSDKGQWAVLSQDPRELKGKLIEGILIGTRKRVLLIDLIRHGGIFRTNSLSQDGFRSTHCLVSDSSFPPISDDVLFSAVEIDLTGYEAWLRLGSINSVRTESSISVEYRKSDPITFEFEDGQVSIDYKLLGPIIGSHRGDSLSLNEKASLVYRPKTSMSLEGMRRQLRSLEDLLIILTNSDYCLPWPPKITLALPLKDLTFEWYLYRIRSSADPPHWHDCLTNFVQIREIFGTIVSAWIKKREQFGPGFYLYLAVRRNWRLYTEHLFVNLIWD